jgi:hypothetical protein
VIDSQTVPANPNSHKPNTTRVLSRLYKAYDRLDQREPTVIKLLNHQKSKKKT